MMGGEGRNGGGMRGGLYIGGCMGYAGLFLEYRAGCRWLAVGGY